MTKAADLANLIGNINAGGGGVNRNVIINGAMNVAQRGTQTSHSSGYTLDRWNVYTTSAARFTISQESDVPSGEGFANSIKLDVTTADSSVASSDFGVFRTILEGQDLQSFCKGTSNAKPFALQFFIKSTVTGTYAIELVDSDNSRAVTKTYTVNSADTWEKKTITFPADTTGAFTDDNNSSLFIQWGLIMGDNYTSGTASGSWESQTTANRFVGQVNAVNSTSNNIFFTGIQLEVGQNPTSFEHEPFERTLTKCLRYFRLSNDGSEAYQPLGEGDGHAENTSTFTTGWMWEPEMRAKPTLAVFEEGNTLGSVFVRQDYSYLCDNIAIASGSKFGLRINLTTPDNTAGDTTFQDTLPGAVYATGTNKAWSVDAEL